MMSMRIQEVQDPFRLEIRLGNRIKEQFDDKLMYSSRIMIIILWGNIWTKIIAKEIIAKEINLKL